MKILREAGKCSGCSACFAVCHQEAISMCADGEGFLVPGIDEDKCINCGKCDSVCPAVSNKDKFFKKGIIGAYAVKYKDEKIRYGSASGGFFPAMAKSFIKRGGYVCGCVLESLVPIHIVTDSWNEVLRMRDSKYVQSDMKNCFKEIADFLEEGKEVLFTGTSCQVAGLQSWLEMKNVSMQKLLCVDFFCHGVPSPLIWKEYIGFYRRNKHKNVIDYRFRSKQYGWGKASRGAHHLNSVILNSKKRPIDNVSYLSRMWRNIFFSNLCIRSYCHICPYAKADKPADITMGDFWGLEVVAPEFDDGKGTSVIIVQTEHGKKCFENLVDCDILKVSLNSALKKQGNAFAPSKRGEKREFFWKDYNRKGFDYVAEKYFGYTFKMRIKEKVKRSLFSFGLRDLYK